MAPSPSLKVDQAIFSKEEAKRIAANFDQVPQLSQKAR